MRKRKQKHKLDPKIIGASCALVLCVIIAGFAMFSVMGVKTPDKLGCYKNAPNKPNTYVFMDASTPRWSKNQQASLYNYFNRLWAELGFQERLLVYTSEGDRVTTGAPVPSFHLCGPARSNDEIKEVHGQEGSAEFLQAQKQRLYKRVVKPELDALLTLTPDDKRKQLYQSPVLEMIQALSRELKPGDRLVIASDLIQHTESAKFCRVKNELPNFAAFAKRSVYQRRLKPSSMEGVSVDVLMLQRIGYETGEFQYCTEDELQAFFEDYFIANGALDPEFIRVRIGYAEVMGQ